MNFLFWKERMKSMKKIILKKEQMVSMVKAIQITKLQNPKNEYLWGVH